jgi:predicted XRE-type DNA-binding protein
MFEAGLRGSGGAGETIKTGRQGDKEKRRQGDKKQVSRIQYQESRLQGGIFMNKKWDFIPFVLVTLFIGTVAIANWQHCYNIFRAFANHPTAWLLATSVEIAVIGLSITGLWFKSLGTKVLLYTVLTVLVGVQVGATSTSSFLHSEKGMVEITKTYRGSTITDTVKVDMSVQSTEKLSSFLEVFGIKASNNSVRVLFSIFQVIMPILAYLSEIALALHFSQGRKRENLKKWQAELEKGRTELNKVKQSLDSRERFLNSKSEQVNREFEQLSEQREQLSEQVEKWKFEQSLEQQKLKSEQEVLNSKIQSFEQQKLRFKITKEVIEKTGVEQFLNRGLNSRVNTSLNSSEQVSEHLLEQTLNSNSEHFEQGSLNSSEQSFEQSLNSSFEQSKTKGEQFITILLNNPELSQNEIGRRIGMGPSSVSNFVKKYFEKGLVNRVEGKWNITDLEKAIVFARDGGSGE